MGRSSDRSNAMITQLSRITLEERIFEAPETPTWSGASGEGVCPYGLYFTFRSAHGTLSRSRPEIRLPRSAARRAFLLKRETEPPSHSLAATEPCKLAAGTQIFVVLGVLCCSGLSETFTVNASGAMALRTSLWILKSSDKKYFRNSNSTIILPKATSRLYRVFPPFDLLPMFGLTQSI